VWQRCTQGVNGALNLPTQPYRPDRGTAGLITLGSHRDLTREAVEAVAWGGERLALAPAALERVAAGQAELLALLAGGARVYGVNTGMGFFAPSTSTRRRRPAISATCCSAGRSAARRGCRPRRRGRCWSPASATC
jgi:hypothetical protein